MAMAMAQNDNHDNAKEESIHMLYHKYADAHIVRIRKRSHQNKTKTTTATIENRIISKIVLEKKKAKQTPHSDALRHIA